MWVRCCTAADGSEKTPSVSLEYSRLQDPGLPELDTDAANRELYIKASLADTHWTAVDNDQLTYRVVCQIGL